MSGPVRCGKCQRTLMAPAGAPLFRCPCGSVLNNPYMAKKQQVQTLSAPPQNANRQVNCPNCKMLLNAPAGHPRFRCGGCNTVLANPFFQQQNPMQQRQQQQQRPPQQALANSRKQNLQYYNKTTEKAPQQSKQFEMVQTAAARQKKEMKEKERKEKARLKAIADREALKKKRAEEAKRRRDEAERQRREQEEKERREREETEKRRREEEEERLYQEALRRSLEEEERRKKKEEERQRAYERAAKEKKKNEMMKRKATSSPEKTRKDGKLKCPQCETVLKAPQGCRRFRCGVCSAVLTNPFFSSAPLSRGGAKGKSPATTSAPLPTPAYRHAKKNQNRSLPFAYDGTSVEICLDGSIAIWGESHGRLDIMHDLGGVVRISSCGETGGISLERDLDGTTRMYQSGKLRSSVAVSFNGDIAVEYGRNGSWDAAVTHTFSGKSIRLYKADEDEPAGNVNVEYCAWGACEVSRSDGSGCIVENDVGSSTTITFDDGKRACIELVPEGGTRITIPGSNAEVIFPALGAWFQGYDGKPACDYCVMKNGSIGVVSMPFSLGTGLYALKTPSGKTVLAVSPWTNYEPAGMLMSPKLFSILEY